ncbi:MAG: ParA family protein [Solirubrobacteraceae bacterium]
MTLTIAVANQKGGVGKTTSATSIGVLLAQRGRRVLLVDTDPQRTLTRQLGLDGAPPTLADVLAGREDVAVGDAIVRDVFGLDVLPAGRQLAGVEMALVGVTVGRELYLADALEPILADYDDVVIDTPPNLGLLTVNALMCADVVLAPVGADDEASVQGLRDLRATLGKLERSRSGQPHLVPVITRWQSGRIVAEQVTDALAALDFALAGRIPDRAAVPQAGALQIPLAHSAPDNAVTLAYARIVDELVGERVA